jgi:uncharacterized protein YndB with AHSA1/START domain
MDLTDELRYAADPKTVFSMLTDEEFLARKAVATGALSHEVSAAPRDDGGVTVRVQRVLPAKVPDFVRRFVGETIDVDQTDEWGPEEGDGARSGRFTATISGAPATMQGDLRLEADGDNGSVERFDGEVKVSIPFVGGKIEQVAANAVLAAVKKEGQVGRAWLSERA